MDSKDFITRVIAAEGMKNVKKLKITDAYMFCLNDTRIDILSDLDFSECVRFDSMFSNCTGTTIPALDTLDTSNGTTFSMMFNSCTNLTTIPALDTSSGINFKNMFTSCKKLTTIPDLDTSSGERFDNMFDNCDQITTIPALDTSRGRVFASMFVSCDNLTTIPVLDVSNGVNHSAMFSNCINLTTVQGLDVNNSKNLTGMFYNCKKLTNLTLYNIRYPIQIGSDTSWGHLLTVDSLVHTIQELCTASSSQTLTMGSANLEKIANLYCKVIDGSNEKKPMELCESTDEGAMTLTAYAHMKNWNLA